MAPAEAACLNCGLPLRGRYCHGCGQEAAERLVPLRRLLREALGDLLTLDSRLLRTLRPLFLAPGLLTVDWVTGRRARHVPPFRLYLFVAAFFFVVLAASDAALIEASFDNGSPPSTAPGLRPTEETPGLLGGFLRRFERAWRSDPSALQNRLVDRLGTLSLMLPPVFALLLVGLYRNRRRFFVEHLVFALHLHALGFLLLAIQAPLPDPAGAVSGPLAVAITTIYAFLALRRVYGGRAWATTLRLAAAGLAYTLVGFLPLLMAAFVWTVLTS